MKAAIDVDKTLRFIVNWLIIFLPQLLLVYLLHQFQQMLAQALLIAQQAIGFARIREDPASRNCRKNTPASCHRAQLRTT